MDAKLIAKRRCIRVPSRETATAYLRFLLVFCLFFALAYFATQLIAPPPRAGLHLYFDWERDVPLVPWMIWPYMSLITAFSVPLVQFTRREMRRLTRQSVFCLCIAAMVFLAMPSVAGFPQTSIDGFHKPIFDLLYTIDTPQNLVPSLHITFSALILFGAASVTSGPIRYLYVVWLGVMTVSVVLVHQHHVVDAVAGFALARAGGMLFPLRA